MTTTRKQRGTKQEHVQGGTHLVAAARPRPTPLRDRAGTDLRNVTAPGSILELQRLSGNQAVSSLLTVQRMKLLLGQAESEVGAFKRRTNESLANYVARLRKSLSDRGVETDDADGRHIQEAAQKKWFADEPKKAAQVTEKVVRTVTGQRTIEGWDHVKNRANWAGFFNGLGSTGHTVRFAGHTNTVRVSPNDGFWCYLDQEGGELEEFPANQLTGQTTGASMILTDYDVIERTVRGRTTTVMKPTRTYLGARDTSRTHAYTAR